MNQVLIDFDNAQKRSDLPAFKVGDSISVHTLIREGNRTRTQVFNGLVIAMSGKGATRNFTVRKISNGVGVEKIFPFNSKNVAKVEVLKSGKVRRAKLYFLRDRVGKAAIKVKPGKAAPVIENTWTQPEAAEAEPVEEVAEVVAETASE